MGSLWLSPSAVRGLAVVAGLLGLLLPVGVVKWSTDLESVTPVEEGGPLRPEMVVIPAGFYAIGTPGSEERRASWELPERSVELSQPFAISITEVTRAQYLRVVGTSPPEDSECGPDCPVTRVSWHDAVLFLNELSDLDPDVERRCYDFRDEQVTWVDACDGYRLPTEAEWEVAARAGSGDRYAGTGEPSEVCQYANVADVRYREAEKPEWETFPCDDGYVGLAPVARFQPNGYQLYDMTGNAWEWVWDWFDEEVGAPKDPRGPTEGRGRVVRGGSFGFVPQFSRVAYRLGDGPSDRDPYLGFRVARSLP